MFIDTHCHPYSHKQKNLTEVFSNFKKLWWQHLVCIGTNPETSQKSIDLAREHDFISASIWIHPCDVDSTELEDVMWWLEKLFLENKEYIVGLGETGLDYYHNDSDDMKVLQKAYFRAHIALARKYNLPIIIHNRDSKDDVLEILTETWFQNFIFHCYSENLEYAQKLIALAPDCKISFSGIVTFKNAPDTHETAVHIPLKNILVETDAPYLTPVPYRGKEENEPGYTRYCLEKIIELRDEPRDEIIETIFRNSCEVFGLSVEK